MRGGCGNFWKGHELMAVAAALIGLAAAGVGAAGAAGAFGSPDVAQVRNPVRDFRNMLTALENTQARRYGLESTERPLYTALDLETLRNSLLGVPDSTRTESYADYGNMSAFERGYMPPTMRTRTTNVPGQPGLLDILGEVQPRADELTIEGMRRQREAELQDVMTYGPMAREAFAKTYPEQEAMLQRLMAEAQSDLAAGTTLSPEELRLVQQNVRAGQAARGMGYGPSDVAEEAVATSLAGMDLRQRRLDNARAISSLFSATTPDPFLAVTRTPFQSGGQGMALLGAGQGVGAGGGQTFNGFLPYLSGVSEYNANAINANNLSNRNNQAALFGSLLSAGGQLGSSYVRSTRTGMPAVRAGNANQLYGPGY